MHNDGMWLYECSVFEIYVVSMQVMYRSIGVSCSVIQRAAEIATHQR